MNTSNFQSEANRAACSLDNQMRAVCGVGKTSSASDAILPNPNPPLTAQELMLMNALLAISGRDGFTVSQKIQLDALVKRYMANGGADPYNAPVNLENSIYPQPKGGSFATNSIDNLTDLINFWKAACIIGFGASLNPVLAVPTQIIIGASFIYALRFQIQKFTLKLNIHGHR